MERVSFEIAKYLKDVGYPQDFAKEEYLFDINGNPSTGFEQCEEFVRPTYLELWLWLWREKKIRICLEDATDSKEPEIERGCYVGTNQLGGICSSQEFADPEDAIVDIIEHFVKNNLIK